eukprot:CAMPEP_0117509484 /NCGR_PEP_ID=MMETSP0784-20121206/27498_1 /TAXON_ID=39447 /ORGANISM="" /LENGTH=624 /DNA_ID=CAMNT_0005305091 /DNA_START=79 /DNA_END=1950 /DNA_ORIENTATION=+
MSYDGGESPFELGILGSMDKFGQVATAFLWGLLLSKHEAKSLLVVGLFWKAFCCFLFGHYQQQSMTWMTKLCMLATKLGMGITEALVSVWATSWVLDHAPPERASRWQGFAGASAGLGSGIGSGVASLWDPIDAFFLQAAILGLIWVALLFTDKAALKLHEMSSEHNEMHNSTDPRQFLAEWVTDRYKKHRVVIIESVRLPSHYLDATEEPSDCGFKVRFTKGDPSEGDWAQFWMLEEDGFVSFESVRLPGHFLDATGQRSGIMDKRQKVLLSERTNHADGSYDGLLFRLNKIAGDDTKCSIESLRQSHHYLDATGERVLRGGTKVRFTKGDPSDDWAHFRLHDVLEHKPMQVFRNDSFENTTLPEKLAAVLGNATYVWTAMAISLSCFVTSGVSFLWQNAVGAVWGFSNAFSYACFIVSTGGGGVLGLWLGPFLFDRYLGGFKDDRAKALCLLWCKRLMFVAAMCSSISTFLLAEKTVFLVKSNSSSVVYWQFGILLTCVFALFVCINSIIGTLYGINTSCTRPEYKTITSGLTVSFQNVFGYAFGPLVPGAFVSFVEVSLDDIWPNVTWNQRALDGAKFAAGMGLALISTWLLFLFTRWAFMTARIRSVSVRFLTLDGARTP